MRIETYFTKVRAAIESCSVAQLTHIFLDKRSTHTGFIKAEISFLDGSSLYVREFVDVESSEDRLMYVYQYVSHSERLIFRYDNTGHHKRLMLPTYPHHKHAGSENVITASPPVDLSEVLEEIEGRVLSSI